MTDQALKPLLGKPISKPLRFVAIGECMVELAPAQQPGQFRQSFAGDTLNTAWYLKQLRPDWISRFVSRVGHDAISSQMIATLAQAGLDTGHLQRSDTRTLGLYLISLDKGERSFSYWRDTSAARQLADSRSALEGATQDADIIFFSGITMAILDGSGRETLLDILKTARASGKTVAFDPNLRPRLWPDRAAMKTAIMQAATVSDMVVPSFDEEADHFGDADIASVVRRYTTTGAQSVIVKNGPDRVRYAHLGQTGNVTPQPLDEIVDTTSAGDSFNAGLIAGLGQGLEIRQAIGFAAQVARQVIGQRGALIALDRNLLSDGT